MKLPKITNQQQALIRLLYSHRFLDRTQIQALLKHKDKRRISAWLKDLREKHYIEWIYNPHDFALKTKPAIYYLSLNGIRYLRSLELYPEAELRKRYKEASRQPDFISRCLILADCCVTLEQRSIGDVSYAYVVESDYVDPENEYHFLSELRPHLCFVKQEATRPRGKETRAVTTNYLLEMFDATTPRYMVKKRLKDYAEYLDGGEWEQEADDIEPPIVLIACPTTAELTYAKRRTRKLLEDITDTSTIHIRFATLEKLRLHGVTGIIWEEVNQS